MTKKRTPASPPPPLDLPTRHHICHWTRIVGDYMLTLANDVPSLLDLEKMSRQQRQNLAGDLIANAVYVLREFGWDKVLRWLRDNTPQGLVGDLHDKYNALPIHEFQYVGSVMAETEPGTSHVTLSPGPPLPDTPSTLLHLRDTLRAFGKALLQAIKHIQSSTPPDVITSVVALDRYIVSRATLTRAVKKRVLTDYRPPDHVPNATLLLSESEVAAKYPKRLK